jgi:hypothetical protein
MHGLIFELKERMNSRQDQPVITNKQIHVLKEQTGITVRMKIIRKSVFDVGKKRNMLHKKCINIAFPLTTL